MTAIATAAEINEVSRELAAEELDRIAGGWPGSTSPPGIRIPMQVQCAAGWVNAQTQMVCPPPEY